MFWMFWTNGMVEKLWKAKGLWLIQGRWRDGV